MVQKIAAKWIQPPTIPSEVSESLSEFPLIIRQVLSTRGFDNAQSAWQFLNASAALEDPFLLIDMDKTVTRIQEAIDQKEQIAVYGDFDVDGVTATVLLVEVLQRLGARVVPYIPDRIDEGYGLNHNSLRKLFDQEIRLIITVDCGIRSVKEVEFIQSKGVDIIVTDHHHPRERIPPAYAIICQKRTGDIYPNKNLAGVGLAYKLATALLLQFDDLTFNVENWLDLVALGTVADIVPLTGENRTLVRKGIERLREGKRPGVGALAGVSGIQLQNINSGDIGYRLGPRLNAAGRLQSAYLSLQLLLEKTREKAASIAIELDNLNRKRQQLTESVRKEALRIVKSSGQEILLFAADEDFHEGIVGLAASKLTDLFYRPAIVGKISNGFMRASCRSIPEFHITKMLDECMDLLEQHGGHARAAGFTVAEESIIELQERLTQIAVRELRGMELIPVIKPDAEVLLSDLHPGLLDYFDMFEPTGNDNPKPLLISRGVIVKRKRIVGREGQHLKLIVSDGRFTFDAIAFGFGSWLESLTKKIDIIFTYERNYYNGLPNLQLNIKDLKLH
ncbi:MAG TPA: single-stranded-DNA-specific exonuclease RecJ [Anaerolineae bacterium]|nr:single-stranded-DNA-specific exonuclease RecJ [Anaerolineae bacterium]